MATIRELVVKFGFDVDEKPIRKMEESIENLKSGFKAVAAAAAAAAAAIFGVAKTTANYADQIEDTAMSIGISNAALQEMAYAAQLSGGSFEILSDGLRLLSRTAYEASTGMETYAEAYKRIGVSVTDTSGKLKSGDKLLLEIADKFKSMPNGVEKTALAMDLFGRSGAKLIPFLNNGSSAIASMALEARDLGMVMDDASIRAGSDFNDAWDSLVGTLKGIIRIIGSGVIPMMKDLVLQVRGWIKENNVLIKQKLQAFVDGLTTFLKTLWRTTRILIGVFASFINILDKATSAIGGINTIVKALITSFALLFAGSMAKSIYGIVQGVLALAKAFRIAQLSALAIPLLIGAAIAGVLLIVEDFLSWLDGRPSTLGFLLKNKDEVIAKIGQFFNGILETTHKYLRKIIVAFLEFFEVPTDEAEAAFDAVSNAIAILVKTAWPYIKMLGKFFYDSIYKSISNVIKIITSVINWFALLAVKPKAALKELSNTIEYGLKSAIVSTLNSLKNLSNMFLEMVGIDPSIFAEAWDALQNTVLNVVSRIFNYLGAMKQVFLETFRGLVNALTKLFEGDFVEFFKILGTTIFNAIVGIFTGIWSLIGGIIVDVFTGIFEVVFAIANKIGEKLKAAIIDPIINAFADATGFISEKLASILPNMGFDINANDKTQMSKVNEAIQFPFGNVTPSNTTSSIANNSNSNTNNTSINNNINVTVPPGSDAGKIADTIKQSVNDAMSGIINPAYSSLKTNVEY